MGAKKMAIQMGIPFDECKKVLSDFYEKFSKLKEFVDSNETLVKTQGYVEDYMGRRRHLPDALLPELEIQANKDVITDCDVFMNCSESNRKITIRDDEKTKQWESNWDSVSKGFDAKNKFKKLAKNNKVDVKDNGAFISKCMTQCTNARIQGSAASLTKKAMVAIYNDPIMKELGFRLLIPVHDELLGECPVENIEKASQRLTELMIGAALPECTVKMKCDAYMVNHWYADEVSDEIYKSFNSLLKSGENRDDAIRSICDDYPEISENVVVKMCDGEFNTLSEEI